jgi:phage shock protein PspC (stress-responsive transcriptional regulator)
MNKNLYRENGYIGGVCEGLGNWSGIPSILWRIGFILIFPYPIWAYLILWFFIKHKTN